MRTTRRKFVQLMTACMASTAIPALGAIGAKADPSKSIVGISNGLDVPEMVRRAVELSGGVKGLIKRGDTVIIKPNVVVACKPGNGEVTSPDVMREVIKLAREAGAGEVIIAEASGGAQTNKAFAVAGYDDLAAEMGVKLVDLNWDKVKTVRLPEGLAMKDYFIPETVMNADVLINVPVMKTHNQGIVSCAMKNLVGIAPGVMYGWHKGLNLPHDERLPEVITDLNCIRRPDLTVVDATIALAGIGPREMDGGFAYKMDSVIAGRDPVAVDTVCTHLMGIQPKEVGFLALGQEKGLGNANMDSVEVKGTPINRIKRDFRNMDRVEAARSVGDLMGEIQGTKVGAGEVAVFWLGQGGFALKTARNRVLIIDPYLSNSCGTPRLVPIPIEPGRVRADAILLTHDHLDHTDPDTLPGIADGSEATFVGPKSSVEHMAKLGIDESRCTRISRGETVPVRGLRISALYARHTDDSVGYVVDCFGPKVYITGDTEYDERLTSVKEQSPDVMLVCINGKLGNMNIEQAVELTKKIRPKVVIPMHYGMFAENTADPEEFRKRAKAAGVETKVVILPHKGSFVYATDRSEP